MLCFIAEHLRTEVIPWHLKECPDWMALACVQNAVAVPFHLIPSEKKNLLARGIIITSIY